MSASRRFCGGRVWFRPLATRRRRHVDVRQPTAPVVEGAVRFRGHRRVAGARPPFVGAAERRRLGILRLARRPADDEPARGGRAAAEGVDARSRLRQERLLRRDTRRRDQVPGSRSQRARLLRERDAAGAGRRHRRSDRQRSGGSAAQRGSGHREGIERADRAAERRRVALQRRRVLAVPLQEIHRPPHRLLAGRADRLLRRRLRQLHLPALRPRRRLLPRVRKRTAGAHRALLQVVGQWPGGARPRLHLGQPWIDGAATDARADRVPARLRQPAAGDGVDRRSATPPSCAAASRTR
jgi:hypothetical protein